MNARVVLQALGERIRSTREADGLTQRELGERSGIVGKYVSEIERGKRDVPISTLAAIVEQGLARRLEIEFRDHTAGDVADLEKQIAALPANVRAEVIALVETIVRLAR